MPLSDAKKKAVKKYLNKFERVYFRVPVGDRNKIKDYAESRGESVNAFILRAIKETMERDSKS